MAGAGLSLLGSATLADNHEGLLIDERAAAAIRRLTTARQRQLALDFAVDRRFRRDVFVRGQPRLAPAAAARQLDSIAIGCPEDPRASGRPPGSRAVRSIFEPTSSGSCAR